ncbi:hypothetical protein [Desulfosporosinus sp. FKB]|uniref:hypothetical protein n=1 Tax=Desulfosporosinus sp. FKB TaxID=1969835 RepID=UPI000B49FABA|nr:hypothetical protein [Desulfosporosinus sp. FKB]
MANFKDYLASDLDIFFNLDELGEEHIIDDKLMTIVPDNEELKERKLKAAEGTYLGDLLFHVRKSEWGLKPSIKSQIIKFDGKKYHASDYQENDGVCTIILEAIGS